MHGDYLKVSLALLDLFFLGMQVSHTCMIPSRAHWMHARQVLSYFSSPITWIFGIVLFGGHT